MPPKVAEACAAGNLVIFAGAGVSTESDHVLPNSLYDDLANELELGVSEELAFPALMTKFELAHGRPLLLKRIKARFDSIESFRRLDVDACQFHRELSTVYTISDICTTNWDTYFERDCRAQPFVSESDWAFWESDGRKVFKLHGSINNPGSIVATEADYDECYRNLNEGLVGAQLKNLLATKTVVFLGYSFRDSDFARLYNLLKDRMRDILPRSFVVVSESSKVSELAKDMQIIETDATYFIHKLKDTLPPDCFIPDRYFDEISAALDDIVEINLRLLDEQPMSRDPAVLMSGLYHDGLKDAFFHQLDNLSSGVYSHRCKVREKAGAYERLQKEKVREDKWADVAYLEGYINGLTFLLLGQEGREALPRYYVVGYEGELCTYEQFGQVSPSFETLSPDAFRVAKRISDGIAPGDLIVHRPLLG